jgi:hypothetical protein
MTTGLSNETLYTSLVISLNRFAFAKNAGDEKYAKIYLRKINKFLSAIYKRLQELEHKAAEWDKERELAKSAYNLELVGRVIAGDEDALREWKEKE